jgi:hypothetical protein
MPNIYNQIKTAFRFYESLEFQAANSDICEGVVQQEWLLMNEVIMPFQIRKDHYAFNIVIYLYDVNTNTETDITADLVGDLHLDLNVEIEGEYYDFISYIPDTAAYVIDPGVYYLRVHDVTGNTDWFSEYFEMVCSDLSSEMTRMEAYLSGSGNLIADTGVKIKIQNNII